MEKNHAPYRRLFVKALPLVAQASREALTYLLAIGLLLPAPHFAQAATASADSSAQSAGQSSASASAPALKVLGKAQAILNEVQKNPKVADADKKLTQVQSLLGAVEDNLRPQFEQINQELKAARKQAFVTGQQSDWDQVKQIELKLEPWNRMNELRRSAEHTMGLIGAGFEGTLLIDKKGALDADNLAKVKVSMPPSEGSDGSFSEFKRKMADTAAGTYGAAKNFRNEYVVFSVAMLFISLAHMNWDPVSNPMALEQWEKQSTDLVGIAGFGMFMLANHKVINMMNSARNARLAAKANAAGLKHYPGPPTHLMNYIGMSAGMIASSMFHEMWVDKDIWQCVRPQYDSRAKVVDGACDRAFRTWVDGKKVMQYAPTIISMIASTAIAEVGRTAIVKSGVVGKGKQAVANVVFKGARMLPMGGVARKGIAWAMGLTVPGAVVKVGNMVIFLSLDTYVTAEPTNQLWQEVKNNWFDVEGVLRAGGLHSEFFNPKKGALQPIDNAFDVKATNLRDSHGFMMDFYQKMSTNGWQRPAAPEACAPQFIQDAKKNQAKTNYEDESWFNWAKRMNDYYSSMALWSPQNPTKSNEQLNCEVMSRPADMIARYGEKNAEWRTTLLGHFATAQNNWVTMIGNFNQTYGASWNLAKYLANAKLRHEKGLDPKPDLSREALAKAISMPVPKEGEDPFNPDHAEKANSWYLEGTGFRLPTPEMVDYVVAGFACGPELTMNANQGQGVGVSRMMDQVYASFMHVVKSPSYLSTPYGSSLRFVPPKLSTKGREICANIDQDVFKNIRYMIGDGFAASIIKKYLPEKTSANASVVTTPFSGPFRDAEGKTYASLAEYVYENLDPSLYKADGNYANVGTWWEEHFAKPVEPVWKNYELVYSEFLKSSFTPVLFEKEYRHGCKPAATNTVQINGRNVKISDPIAKDKVDADGLVAPRAPGKDGRLYECEGDSTAYRVANGVFLSIEIELRNYMRGLFSLYMSAIPKADEKEAAKKTYLAAANEIIEDVKSVSATDIQSDTFSQRMDEADEKAKALIEMIEVRLKASSAGDQGAYRLEMLAKFKEALSKIMTEQRDHAGQYSRLSLKDAAKGGAVQNVNSKPASSLIKRHGG